MAIIKESVLNNKIDSQSGTKEQLIKFQINILLSLYFMTSQNHQDNHHYNSFQDLNLAFYKELLTWINEKTELQFYNKVITKQNIVQSKLKQLHPQELMEWAQTLSIKFKQLYNSHTSQTTDELLSTLYILVHCSKKLNSIKQIIIQVPYDYSEVNKVIKQSYYEIYKDKIVDLFKKSGFQTEEFQILEYQDPLLKRIWRAIFD